MHQRNIYFSHEQNESFGQVDSVIMLFILLIFKHTTDFNSVRGDCAVGILIPSPGYFRSGHTDSFHYTVGGLAYKLMMFFFASESV